MKKFPILYKRTSNGKTQEWEIHVEKTLDGFGVMVTTFGLSEGKKQTLREEIKSGKNVGKKNQTTAYEQACAEAESRWNKQKDRKGYGLTVKQSASVRAVSPMLAYALDKMKGKIDWANAFAQPKLDGFRCLAKLSTDGKVQLTSRENQPLAALTHIEKALSKISWPKEDGQGYILDGELYCHGMPLNQISSACKKKSDLSRKIEYHLYDLISHADFGTRSILVSQVVSDAEVSFLKAVETVKVRSLDEVMVCQKEFMEQGYEGAMLRHGLAPYHTGKRSFNLLKVKTFHDDEFVIVDYKMGRGKYADMPVFVCETAEGHHFDVLAPGTLPEKLALGKKAASCVGRKLTVKYQYFTATKEPVPFFPVAKCFKDD